MEKIDRFNIRVYALCIEDQKILTLFESYAGEKLIKLPGGDWNSVKESPNVFTVNLWKNSM